MSSAAPEAGIGIGRAALRIGGACACALALSFAPLRSLTPRLFTRPAPMPQAHAPSDAQDAATLLPEELWIAAEGEGLGAIASGWLDGRVHARLLASPAWKRFTRTAPYAQLLAGLGFAELLSGMKPADLAGALLGEQIVAGVLPDGEQPGVVLAVRTLDADTALHLIGVARNVAAMNKKKEGEGDAAPKSPPTPMVEVGGVEVGGVDSVVLDGKLWLAAVDRHLLAASSERLLGGLVERARQPAATRAVPSLMATLRQRAAGHPLLRFALEARKLASTRPDGRLAPAKADNSGGALLLGDLLELASRADVICGQLDARGDELAATLDVPGDPGQLPPHFRAFAHDRATLPLTALASPNTLLTFSMRRDWTSFWADRAELCVPATEKEFADLKTNLGLFFGGRSLPDDVLPQLDDELLFVLARQTYPGVAEPPKARYPAGAFVYRAKRDPAKLGRDFAAFLQNLLSIINVQRGMDGKPQWMLFVEPFEGITVYGGRAREDERSLDVDLRNYSPCAAWVGDHIVLASTEELLHELLLELKKPASGPAATSKCGAAPAGCTTFLRADGAALRSLALEDRDWLVTNAIVNEGKPKAQAEGEVELLADLLAHLSQATLASSVRPDGMRVELRIELTPFAVTTR